VLPHAYGKRGTVLVTVAVITASMTLKLRFDYVSKYRDPCQPFGRISRQGYGIKDESFGPGGSSGGAGSALPLISNPVGIGVQSYTV
jgi:hypothetical protein